jgi:hypothetical protein
MGAVDIGIHGGKAIGKAFENEALGREMIALVKGMLCEYVEDTRIALQAGGVEDDTIQQVGDAPHPPRRVFQGYPSHKAMYLVSLRKKIFG